MIVEHSIARHQDQRQLCLSAARDLRNLLAERDELVAELNRWRSTNPSLPPREARATAHLRDLLAVEHEIFGSFPNGFGDNAPEEGSGDDYHGGQPGGNGADDRGTQETPMTNTSHQAPPAHSDQIQGSLEVLEFDGVLNLPSMLDDPDSINFAMNGVLDFDPPLDYEAILPHALNTRAIPPPASVLDGSYDIRVSTSHLHPVGPDGISDQYQPMHVSGLPTASYPPTFYRSMGNRIREPFGQGTLNQQAAFPT